MASNACHPNINRYLYLPFSHELQYRNSKNEAFELDEHSFLHLDNILCFNSVNEFVVVHHCRVNCALCDSWYCLVVHTAQHRCKVQPRNIANATTSNCIIKEHTSDSKINKSSDNNNSVVYAQAVTSSTMTNGNYQQLNDVEVV
jgi:hypothetical protein